jgi:hypothetical protein
LSRKAGRDATTTHNKYIDTSATAECGQQVTVPSEMTHKFPLKGKNSKAMPKQKQRPCLDGHEMSQFNVLQLKTEKKINTNFFSREPDAAGA